MNSTDPFLTYEVQKTVASALKLPAFRDKVKWLLTVITAEINVENVSATRLVRFLEIYKLLLARKCSQNIVLLEESEHLWLNMCPTILVNLVEKGQCLAGETHLNWLLFTFFCVWHKIIKITFSTENDWKFQFYKKCFLEFHENMLYFIKYLDLDNMLIINKKVIHIFNTFLSYAATLSSASALNNCFIVVAQNIVNFIQKSGIASIPIRQGKIGFGGDLMTFSHDEVHAEFDMSHLRGISQLLIKSSAILSKDWIQERNDPAEYTAVFQVLYNLDEYIKQKLELKVNCVPFCWLPHLYGDQDDDWIEALLALLDIAVMVLRKQSPKDPKVEAWICPHFLFRHFLHVTIFDHSVLVDLLASPETCFLNYLLKYLKYTLNTWDQFISDHERCITPSNSHIARKMGRAGKQVVFDSLQGHLPTMDAHSVSSKEVQEIMDMDNAEIKDDASILNIQKSRDVTRINSAIESNTDIRFPKGKTKSFGLSLIEGYGYDLDNESDNDVNDDDDNYINDSDKFMNDTSSLTDLRYGNEQIVDDNDSYDDSEDIADDKDVSLIGLVVPADELNSRKSEHLSLDGTGESESVHNTSMRSSQSILMLAASESGGHIDPVLSEIDRTMSTLIRLRLKLERLWQMNLFPYNPKPLLKLQVTLELKYEEWLSERYISDNLDHE
ncbi:hypothetical protein CHS0354_038817 [Potamilus streckersoni]|nr:hypothetical protein CHS0354_038817 [Potamilus streckersoni]